MKEKEKIIIRVNSKLVATRALELYKEGFESKDVYLLVSEELGNSPNAVQNAISRNVDKFPELRKYYKTKPRKVQAEIKNNNKSSNSESVELIETQPIEENTVVLPQEVSDFRQILKCFKDKFHQPSMEEIEALQSQYIILSQRGLDPVLWMTTCITEIGGKDPSKRTVNYLIGYLRHRMTKGWGVTKSEDEDSIVLEIETLINSRLSIEQRTAIYRLMGQYGGVRLAMSINKVDISQAFLNALTGLLRQQYDANINLRNNLREATYYAKAYDQVEQ